VGLLVERFVAVGSALLKDAKSDENAQHKPPDDHRGPND
jgi:hypothetical protein